MMPSPAPMHDNAPAIPPLVKQGSGAADGDAHDEAHHPLPLPAEEGTYSPGGKGLESGLKGTAEATQTQKDVKIYGTN
jgi:hypothetical protein